MTRRSTKMRNVGRRIFRSSAAVSFVFSLVTGLLCLRSYWTAENFTYRVVGLNTAAVEDLWILNGLIVFHLTETSAEGPLELTPEGNIQPAGSYADHAVTGPAGLTWQSHRMSDADRKVQPLDYRLNI